MNELTKEARAREYAAAMNRRQQMNNEALQNRDALANAMAGPKYGDKSLNPDRPLTGRARSYLTKWDEGSRCDRINIQCRAIRDHICDICYHGKDTSDTCSRRDCPEREESRTGINLDKIIEWGGDNWDFTTARVSDEYRKISDEVEQEIGE